MVVVQTNMVRSCYSLFIFHAEEKKKSWFADFFKPDKMKAHLKSDHEKIDLISV